MSYGLNSGSSHRGRRGGFKISKSTSSQEGSIDQSERLFHKRIQTLISNSLPQDSALTPLKGLKIDLSANLGFRKFFYTARCACGTAALVSVEVARSKSIVDIEQALPELARKLGEQASAFYAMSCATHEHMRMGPLAKPNTRPSG